MCLSGVTYLPVDCCFSELVGLVSEWSDISTRGLWFQ
jgi:hypothetical protein